MRKITEFGRIQIEILTIKSMSDVYHKPRFTNTQFRDLSVLTPKPGYRRLDILYAVRRMQEWLGHFIFIVGARGFEPPISWSQTKRLSR
jgi:hypothetical protein